MRLLGVVRVVAVGLAGEDDMQTVMHVIVPLRIVSVARAGVPRWCASLVFLEDQ